MDPRIGLLLLLITFLVMTYDLMLWPWPGRKNKRK